jgi:hypothetical protein
MILRNCKLQVVGNNSTQLAHQILGFKANDRLTDLLIQEETI